MHVFTLKHAFQKKEEKKDNIQRLPQLVDFMGPVSFQIRQLQVPIRRLKNKNKSSIYGKTKAAVTMVLKVSVVSSFNVPRSQVTT